MCEREGLCVYMCVCLYVCACMCVSVCVCMYVYVCVYVYKYLLLFSSFYFSHHLFTLFLPIFPSVHISIIRRHYSILFAVFSMPAPVPSPTIWGENRSQRSDKKSTGIGELFYLL